MKNFFAVGIGLMLLAPALALATSHFTNQVPGTGGFTNTVPGGSSYSGSGGPTESRLVNPLGVKTVCGLIKSILQAILVIGLPIAVLFLVFAGLRYVAALGNPTKITEANKNLLYTVVGIAIFLGAALIAQVLATTISQIASQSGAAGAGFQDVSSCN